MSHDAMTPDEDNTPTWEIMRYETDGTPLYECEECETLFTEVRDKDVQCCPDCYEEWYA